MNFKELFNKYESIGNDVTKKYLNGEVPYDVYSDLVFESKFSELTITEKNIPKDFCVLDFETTGFNANKDSIISVGIIKFRNFKEVERFYTLVEPMDSIPSKITELTGIKNSDVIDAPNLSTVVPAIMSFLQDDIIIGHNVTFDLRFLSAIVAKTFYEGMGNFYVDTLKLSKKYIPTENHKLETLKNYLGLSKNAISHNALYDCLMAKDVYIYCLHKYFN